MVKKKSQALYDNVFETLFLSKYRQDPSAREIAFTKDDIDQVASRLGKKIRNLPDVIYTYRVRRELPKKILETGFWIIRPAGKGKYFFTKTDRSQFIEIQEGLAPIEVLNAAPEIVENIVLMMSRDCYHSSVITDWLIFLRKSPVFICKPISGRQFEMRDKSK